MGCYLIPAAAALCHYLIHRKKPSIRGKQLNYLLLGGTTFGFVDHLWNGELLMFGNFWSDMTLGVTITLSIFAIWKIMNWQAQSSKATA